MPVHRSTNMTGKNFLEMVSECVPDSDSKSEKNVFKKIPSLPSSQPNFKKIKGTRIHTDFRCHLVDVSPFT